MASNAFLFTWKPDKWPFKELRALVDAFETGSGVVEPWRCQAHKAIRPGDRAYLYKQGNPPCGIFGVAEVIGPAEERSDAKEGESRFAVPLRFEVLLDPTKRFLVSKADLLKLPVPDHRWDTQGSGVKLEAEAARFIDAIAAKEHPIDIRTLDTGEEDKSISAGKRERLAEVYERDQHLVTELKRRYKGVCQICATEPFGGAFGDIVEGHHIEWLSRGGSDSLENLMLLCPNHHAAVHATDPLFDRAKLEFRFGSKTVPVRHDLHLKPT